MRNATIQKLYRYPVKGARGEPLDALMVDRAVGVQGDRRFGIKRNAGQSDVWAAKTHFRVCLNTPEMAAQKPLYRDDADTGAPHRALDAGWLAQVAAVLDESSLGIVDTQGAYNLVDTNPYTNGPTISFLNLASVRALEAATGWSIDPQRFRMNVWYDDDAPWSELAWAKDFPGTQEIAVGDTRMRIRDACERCRATEASPQTGARDLPILDALAAVLKERGYGGSPHRGSFQVMGFLATPLADATIAPGQTIRLL